MLSLVCVGFRPRATQGAVIRYTTDGSMPSETHGVPYGGPVPVERSMTIRAVAYRSDLTTSAVTAAALGSLTCDVVSSSTARR